MVQDSQSNTEEETRSFLISLPVFSSFNVDEIAILSKHMSYIHLESGEYLFMEGDQATSMGFIVNGILEVQKRADTGENITLLAIVHICARIAYNIFYLINSDKLRSIVWFVATLSSFGIIWQCIA